MTAENTPARDDLRQKMLTDARAHHTTVTAELETARAQRDSLRAELKRITSELQNSIAAGNAVIRDLVTEQEEAEALVKSLTPRTRKPSGAGLFNPGSADPNTMDRVAAVRATQEAAERNADTEETDTEHGSA
jgi:hypothetical protein